jgi:hypothetical protein
LKEPESGGKDRAFLMNGNRKPTFFIAARITPFHFDDGSTARSPVVKTI